MASRLQQSSPRYPVFVMCGRDPERRRLMQALDPEGRVPAKALLPFLGKRVIDWQLEALRNSAYLGEIYLLGLTQRQAAFSFPVNYVPTELTAGFAEKLLAGVEILARSEPLPPFVVVSSSDAPALRTASVDRFLEALPALQGHDFVLSVVPEHLAEAVFPGARRVVARFRDRSVFPGELYALSPRAIQSGAGIIRAINARRRDIDRSGLRISLGPVLRFIGRRPAAWPGLLKFLLGRATIADGELTFSVAFNCKAKTVVVEDAGFGMDMDLVEDYTRLEAYVSRMEQGEHGEGDAG